MAALVLLLPGLGLLKEWAYSCVAFTWMMAVLAQYSAGDGVQVLPLILLALLIVSYFTRPSSRRVTVSPAPGKLSGMMLKR